jgi:hypothetical protein
MNGTGLAKTQNVLNMKLSIRRIGLCWEATRAPRWTRIPQAWAALVAQAGLLRARQQSEKSTGLCGRASSNSKALKTKSKTSTNAGKKSVSLLSHAAFHAEPVHLGLHGDYLYTINFEVTEANFATAKKDLDVILSTFNYKGP